MTFWLRRAAQAVIATSTIAFVSGCSCAATHDLDAGAWADADAADGLSTDGPIDAAAADAWETLDLGGADDGVCHSGQARCNTDADCEAWNAAVGPPGTFVSSTCREHTCTLGTLNCSTHDLVTHCFCYPDPRTTFGAECLGDEICVSDSPGGPTRCALECVGR